MGEDDGMHEEYELSSRQRQVIAASWALAAAICRQEPRLTVFETHPGGGQYDCLTFMGAGAHLDINRAGSLHVHKAPNGATPPAVPPERWVEAASSGNAAGFARGLCGSVGLPASTATPPATPRTLQYRVIARLLASRMLDSAAWDARGQYEDTSGFGGGLRGPVPSAEMALIPANLLWRVLRGGVPVAWLWDGWAWTAGGDRLDLMARYARGARIDELVGLITPPPSARRAEQLPALPRLPEQPVGTWP